jgi:radical SAM superfamily enzyme YgiQ (UPF0313 family)
MNVRPIFFGFESGDEQTLKYLKCGKTTVAENKEAVRLCQRYGFNCCGGLIIGSPGETLEQMENTIRFIDWAKKHGIMRLSVAVLYPFPGTPVWDVALKMGKVGTGMNFDVLKVTSKEATEGMLVDDAIKLEFIKLRDRVYRHIHSFKWTKARMLLRHSPWETLKFAFQASPSIIKRQFTPSIP